MTPIDCAITSSPYAQQIIQTVVSDKRYSPNPSISPLDFYEHYYINPLPSPFRDYVLDMLDTAFSSEELDQIEEEIVNQRERSGPCLSVRTAPH